MESASCKRDEKLRKFGYRIHSRPKDGPVLWQSPDGEVVWEAVAARTVEEIEEAARKMK